MTELNDAHSIVEPFLLAAIGDEFFLIHNTRADIFHLNPLSKLYVECLQQGIAKGEIVSAVAERFSKSPAEVEQDFNVFLHSLAQGKSTAPEALHQSLQLFEPADFVSKPAPVSTTPISYSAAGLLFRISCENPQGLLLIDTRLQLMRVAAQPNNTACEIAVITGENGFAIQVNGVLQVAVADNTWLDVLVMQAMLDHISLQSSNTVILHAAALANTKGEAVIFAAPSGAGKSTLATFLALEGYEYLGDDIVLLNPETQEVTPFPTAPNLKPGSWGLFDKTLAGLSAQSVFRPEIKPVKFAKLLTTPLRYNTYRITALVFPEFGEGTSADLKPLNLAESLAYLSEIRHNSGQKNLSTTARQLIRFTNQTPCYALQYGSLSDFYALFSQLYRH